MIVIKFYELHLVITLCTFERVVAKRQKDILTPFCKGFHQTVLGFWDSFPKCFVCIPASGIKPIVTCHFKVFFRDVLNQELYKINDRKCPFYKGIVLVPVIVKSDIAAIIGINPFEGNDGASEIAADIFNHRIGITEIGFCINIKTILILTVDKGFRFFERRSNAGFKKIEEGCLKGLSKKGIVKMLDDTPKAVIREAAFRNETVDMRVPFQRSPKSVEGADNAGNKVFRFVEVMEHTQNNTADSLKKAVKERTVFQKKVSKIFINGKNAMAVSAAY